MSNEQLDSETHQHLVFSLGSTLTAVNTAPLSDADHERLRQLTTHPAPLVRLMSTTLLLKKGDIICEDLITDLYALLEERDKVTYLEYLYGSSLLASHSLLDAVVNSGLNSDDRDVVLAASISMRALNGRLNERGISLLIRLTAHLDQELQIQAIYSLGELRLTDEMVVGAIAQRLADTNEDVVYAAAWSLGKISIVNGDIIARLGELLTSPNDTIRFIAARALEEIGASSRAVIDRIIDALNDSYRGVRLEALETIRKIGKDAEPAVDALLALLEDSDSEIRQTASEVLAAVQNVEDGHNDSQPPPSDAPEG